MRRDLSSITVRAEASDDAFSQLWKRSRKDTFFSMKR